MVMNMLIGVVGLINLTMLVVTAAICLNDIFDKGDRDEKTGYNICGQR